MVGEAAAAGLALISRNLFLLVVLTQRFDRTVLRRARP